MSIRDQDAALCSSGEAYLLIADARTHDDATLFEAVDHPLAKILSPDNHSISITGQLYYPSWLRQSFFTDWISNPF
ncbi:MAG: hypothetical protein PHV74_01790 [Dehalococcoidia bacterium]|nr:hypothetical protein [Dehalococcoidia bacterium]